ncbi:MAG TPA: nucleotide sugar dehydrogenase [Blastocatellia bacterium]|nr:nucleotide sugar dehydrogenase [Blastocatellia bacterium]
MSYKQELLDKIAARSARIGVIGLGYVGLPLAVEFARAGLSAIGFEVDPRKAEAINRGESYIIDVPSSAVAELVANDRLQATTDFSALANVDVIIICVPTPLRKTKEPDVSYILAAAEKIEATLRPGQLIILESTTYPGTTDEVLRPMFDAKGLTLDEDYFLAFSPERIDPGNERFNTKNIPKVVGGITPGSTEVAAATYEAIVDKVHRVSSARVAETCKLLENTFRAVNIGLVNELSQLCYTLGIDTWEVIGAAATKPFGFMAFYPGPGIGGHCIPLDPHYLSWKARMHGFEARFISLAEEVNSRMPEHVVELVADGLNRQKKPVNGSKILILGVAYKRDIDDMRESPALAIIEKLEKLGGEVSYHDPYVPQMRLDGGEQMQSVELTEAMIDQADCVVIVTDHRNIDYRQVAERAKLIVDSRNATKELRGSELDQKILRL